MKPPVSPRTVIGYHGCSLASATAILSQQKFTASTKAYDWLGAGVYFWEYAPYRAQEWAEQKCAREGGEPAVLQASIRLGRCLNLLDIQHIPGLMNTYVLTVESMGLENLPKNTDRGAHYLDRAIIDAYCRAVARNTNSTIQTVRGSFAEGDPIYPGSKILQRAHTQIAVRDEICISRITLVQWNTFDNTVRRREP